MTCKSCETARKDRWCGMYRADCLECSARALSHSPAFAESQREGKLTHRYIDGLVAVFGSGWKLGHWREKYSQRLRSVIRCMLTSLKKSNTADCTQCGKPFVRRNSLQAVCSPRCAITTVKAKRKAEKEAFRRRQEAAKPRSQWLKEAQAAFNRWIRLRDRDLPCISCGRMHGGQWHAGHYLSTGARPDLRFDEANVHKQCQPCNTHLHGNIALYRVNLINRIGLREVERLEGPATDSKLSIDDIRRIVYEYRARIAEFGNSQ